MRHIYPAFSPGNLDNLTAGLYASSERDVNIILHYGICGSLQQFR